MLYAVHKWILNLIATLNLVDKNANFTFKLRHYDASAVYEKIQVNCCLILLHAHTST